MRGESRKKKKSHSRLKAWLAELLKDLIVAITAAIVSKLLEQQRRGAKALLLQYIILICRKQYERNYKSGIDFSCGYLFRKGCILYSTNNPGNMEGEKKMPIGKPNAQTIASEKYQKKAGYMTKGFKIKREVAERFERACEAAGVSQAAQITELMLSFAKEQEEKNTK